MSLYSLECRYWSLLDDNNEVRKAAAKLASSIQNTFNEDIVKNAIVNTMTAERVYGELAPIFDDEIQTLIERCLAEDGDSSESAQWSRIQRARAMMDDITSFRQEAPKTQVVVPTLNVPKLSGRGPKPAPPVVPIQPTRNFTGQPSLFMTGKRAFEIEED